ncbi:FliI/YscN family ATPase [Burkholderia pyrrocinia]|nr:FliI/YscN family ATPase [Burkholderia pyrrocinia]
MQAKQNLATDAYVPHHDGTGWNEAAFVTALRAQLREEVRAMVSGRLLEVRGNQVKVGGIPMSIGMACRLTRPGWGADVLGEVVGLERDMAIVTLLGNVTGLGTESRVFALADGHTLTVGDTLLGRVLDGLGQPLDDGEPLTGGTSRSTLAAPPSALCRPLIRAPMPTGIRAVDSFLTVGVGQRLGIFAPAGAGKSTLLAEIVKGVPERICVLALIGERGREVQEFLTEALTAAQREHAVLVVATSDRSSLERIKAAYTATTIAEYFRDQGHDVLLLLDSATRFARALRETGLAAGEHPVRRGYPPSVFAALPRLVERAGPAPVGSITAFYTVLLEDAETVDPIGEELRSLLDGHITLSQALAGRGHYPAIDIGQSVSRLMPHLLDRETLATAARARAWLAKYQDAELLLQIGEYKPGADPELDRAVRAWPLLSRYLQQGLSETTSFDDARRLLRDIVVACDAEPVGAHDHG